MQIAILSRQQKHGSQSCEGSLLDRQRHSDGQISEFITGSIVLLQTSQIVKSRGFGTGHGENVCNDGRTLCLHMAAIRYLLPRYLFKLQSEN